MIKGWKNGGLPLDCAYAGLHANRAPASTFALKPLRQHADFARIVRGELHVMPAIFAALPAFYRINQGVPKSVHGLVDTVLNAIQARNHLRSSAVLQTEMHHCGSRALPKNLACHAHATLCL